jgi:hypothetical protein
LISGRARDLSSSGCLRPALGLTQLSTQWKLGTFFPGVKQLGLEAENSLSSSAEVKNAWSYSCTLTFAFMAYTLLGLFIYETQQVFVL